MGRAELEQAEGARRAYVLGIITSSADQGYKRLLHLWGQFFQSDKNMNPVILQNILENILWVFPRWSSEPEKWEDLC